MTLEFLSTVKVKSIISKFALKFIQSLKNEEGYTGF